jgi:hypothetical protein
MGRRKIKLDLDKVEQLASRGLTNDAIAASFGVNRSTLYARKRENEQFEQALSRGRAKGTVSVADALWELIFRQNEDGGYAEPPQVRLKAVQFWLERRAGWVVRDEPEEEPLPMFTDEEIEARSKERLANIERQREEWLPKRRAEVEEMKRQYEQHDSFAPDAEPISTNEYCGEQEWRAMQAKQERAE